MGGSGHGGSGWGRGLARGGLSAGGGGQGTFWSSCHILHYHMVLRPKGTSHNNWNAVRYLRASARVERRADPADSLAVQLQGFNYTLQLDV